MVHDVIKIKYSESGYLPNYPPHLISDDEMCDAFMQYPEGDNAWEEFKNSTNISFYRDMYPVIDGTLDDDYRKLAEGIADEISKFKASLEDDRRLPDWVYSYMLGIVLTKNSPQLDMHDMLVNMGIDNQMDEFTPECAQMCLKISDYQINKRPAGSPYRPPSPFGEPIVLKYLKLLRLNVVKRVI